MPARLVKHETSKDDPFELKRRKREGKDGIDIEKESLPKQDEKKKIKKIK